MTASNNSTILLFYRLKRVYFCYRGIEVFNSFELDSGSGVYSPYEAIELPFTEVYDLSAIVDNLDDVECYNPHSLSIPVIPAGDVPPATQPCSEISNRVPTKRVQYATDEKNLCFGSCYFDTASNGQRAGQRITTVTQCCPGYKPATKVSRFSFLRRPVTCEAES